MILYQFYCGKPFCADFRILWAYDVDGRRAVQPVRGGSPCKDCAGRYRLPFTVPAVSQTSGDLLVEGGESPLQDLFGMFLIPVYCTYGVPDIRQSDRQGC